MTEYKNQTFRKLYDRGGALCLETEFSLRRWVRRKRHVMSFFAACGS
jgi:hypothetical protein